MKVIISAGGTGGHIYPAISIIEELRKREKKLEVLYIGTDDRMEKDIVPKHNIEFIGIKIKGLIRKFSFENIKRCYLFIKSLSTTKKIIKNFAPDIVIGAGGYVTTPVIYMARKLGYKTLIHEQNSIPGMSNKFLGLYSDKICVSFESTLKYFNENKTVYTGNPTSTKYLNLKPINKDEYGLSNNKKLIMIVMGSLGSKTITNKMKEILPNLKSNSYEVVYVTGNDYYEEMNKLKVPSNVKIVKYIDNMGEFMKATDIIISRAGATTMAEIMTLNIPTIFIPSPYVTNNHQYKNAKILEEEKASIILEEENLSLDLIKKNIEYYLNDKNYQECKKNLSKFKKEDSAKLLVDEIIDLVRKDI